MRVRTSRILGVKFRIRYRNLHFFAQEQMPNCGRLKLCLYLWCSLFFICVTRAGCCKLRFLLSLSLSLSLSLNAKALPFFRPKKNRCLIVLVDMNRSCFILGNKLVPENYQPDNSIGRVYMEWDSYTLIVLFTTTTSNPQTFEACH
jgi:hypothetical protein